MTIVDDSSIFKDPKDQNEGCPDCGIHGAHFCPGKPSPPKNHSYQWSNQQKEKKNETTSEES